MESKPVRDQGTHAIRGVIIVTIAVLIIAAGIAFVYANPSTAASVSTLPAHLTSSGSSGSVTAASTSSVNDTGVVYVYLPYGGGENYDGATQPQPQVITVLIGVNNTVTWINQDLITHDVISTTGTFASPDLSPGQSYTFTFTEAGTYPYYDSYTPMQGWVIVENP